MRKLLFCIILCLFSLVNCPAQQLTNYERRCMNAKLLECLISYENYASFAEDYMQYAFIDLFASADAEVYCDYIAASKFGQQIKASEYASYSTEDITVSFIEISNLRKGDYKYQRGRYVVSVEFDKSIEYEDEICTYFTTMDESIGGCFHIVMTCEYNEQEEKFLITSIEGSKNEDSTFPEGKFVIIEYKNERDRQLQLNGKYISFNSFNDCYLTGNHLPVIDDEDIITRHKVIASTDRYDKVNFSYKETRARFRFGVSAAPISAYKVNTSVPFSNVRSSAYEATVDIGYTTSISRQTKLGLYTGLGVAYSQLSMQVDSIQFEYLCPDESFNLYTRQYQINKASEGLSFVDILIPIYASMEMSFGKFAMTLDAGGKLYLNANTKVHPYRVEGTVSAIYSKEATSSFELPGVIDSYMCPASYMRNTYDFALFGKVGAELQLKDRRYLYLKLGYTQGLTDSYRSKMNEWYNGVESIYPFVYSHRSGTDVAVRSFADCISYRRSAITIDFGYRMKF